METGPEILQKTWHATLNSEIIMDLHSTLFLSWQRPFVLCSCLESVLLLPIKPGAGPARPAVRAGKASGSWSASKDKIA